jgi:hypothetical protein
MSDQQDIANREAGPLLEPNERPASSATRWAILIGFAAAVFLMVFSINHKGDQPNAPPAATATGPTPAAPVTPPATPRGG